MCFSPLGTFTSLSGRRYSFTVSGGEPRKISRIPTAMTGRQDVAILIDICPFCFATAPLQPQQTIQHTTASTTLSLIVKMDCRVKEFLLFSSVPFVNVCMLGNQRFVLGCQIRVTGVTFTQQVKVKRQLF